MSKESLSFRAGFMASMTVPAQEAANELARIESRLGRVTPRDVVEVAKDPQNPLHPIFDWNDETAAAKFRLMQARLLIKSIVVEKTGAGDQEPVRITLFHSASDEEGKAYFSINRIAQDVNLFASANASLMEQINNLHKSVASLNLIAPSSKKDVTLRLKDGVDELSDIAEELAA